jgi:hypothetical protein
MRETAAAPRRSLVRRIARIAGIAVSALVVFAGVAFVAFYLYGWRAWKPIDERNGIATSSMKPSGSSLVVYRGLTRFKGSLTSLTRFMQDPSTCDDVGCTDVKILETVSPQTQYMAFVYDYDPFDKRQFVVKVDVQQDAATKEVVVRYTGYPDRLPPDNCCVRVPRMNNTWRFRPVGNGEVEVEYVIDEAEGGLIPFFIANQIHESVAYQALKNIRKFVQSEKFQRKYVDDKTLPYVTEPKTS